MRFTCAPHELRRLGRVLRESVNARGSSRNAGATMQLTAALDGSLTLQVATTDVGVTMQGKALVTAAGSALVELAPFSRVVDQLRGQSALVATAGPKLQVSNETLAYTLPTPGVSTYRVPEPPPAAFPYTFDPTGLSLARLTVSHAVSNDQARPSLQMIVVRNGHVTASDGKRLASVQLAAGGVPDLQLPTSTGAAVSAFLDHVIMVGSTPPMVQAALTATHVHFHAPGVGHLSARAPVATFPDFGRQFQKTAGHPWAVACDAADLREALSSLKAVGPPALATLRLQILREDRLQASIQDSAGHQAVAELTCAAYAGAALPPLHTPFFFNGAHLIEALSEIVENVVTLRFGPPDQGRPAALRIEESLSEGRATFILLAEYGDT